MESIHKLTEGPGGLGAVGRWWGLGGGGSRANEQNIR